jgi:hypothetical protein
LAGKIGDDIMAVIPHKDSYLLYFTATETWVVAGDPTTGQFRRVSDEVGIIGANAWCVNHDTVYFLSEHGLYSVGADGSGLKPISEDRIPEHLTGVSDSACVLDYYHADRGVYVHLTTGPDWFYDTAREQFWPFDTDTTDSHLLVGPIRLGAPNQFGLLQTIHGIMADDSNDVAWRIVPGDTAEEACVNGKAAITAAVAGGDYSAYISSSGEWGEGRSWTGWPRARSMWCCIWLHSEGDWAFEQIILEVLYFGRWR